MTPLAPPSREANPFATCWTRPEALGFVPSRGVNADAVTERLAAAGWRGQIVGPHGVGKSALLRAVGERLAGDGVATQSVVASESLPAQSTAVLLVEAFERLPARERAIWPARWRHNGTRFVVTTHRPIGGLLWRTPVLCRLRTDEALLGRLFERVTRERVTPVTHEQACVSFRRRNGDLRRVWFDLYNLHEACIRGGRTATVRVA